MELRDAIKEAIMATQENQDDLQADNEIPAKHELVKKPSYNNLLMSQHTDKVNIDQSALSL